MDTHAAFLNANAIQQLVYMTILATTEIISSGWAISVVMTAIMSIFL